MPALINTVCTRLQIQLSMWIFLTLTVSIIVIRVFLTAHHVRSHEMWLSFLISPR